MRPNFDVYRCMYWGNVLVWHPCLPHGGNRQIWFMIECMRVAVVSSWMVGWVWCVGWSSGSRELVVSSRCATIRLIDGNTVLIRCRLVYVRPSSTRCWLCTIAESQMTIAGVFSGRSSHTMTRAKSSAVLFVTWLVPYAAGRGCTRERTRIVGRSIHCVVGCELLIVVMVTLAATWAIVGCCGCRSG